MPQTKYYYEDEDIGHDRSRSCHEIRYLPSGTNARKNEYVYLKELGPSTNQTTTGRIHETDQTPLEHYFFDQRALVEFQHVPFDREILDLAVTHGAEIARRYQDRIDTDEGFGRVPKDADKASKKPKKDTVRVVNVISSGKKVALSSNRQHRGDLAQNSQYMTGTWRKQCAELRPFAEEAVGRHIIMGAQHARGSTCGENGSLDTLIEDAVRSGRRSISQTGADDRTFRSPLKGLDVRAVTLRANEDTRNVQYMPPCARDVGNGRSRRGLRDTGGCKEFLPVLGITDISHRFQQPFEDTADISMFPLPETQRIRPRSPSSRALSIRPSSPEVQLITPGSRSSRSPSSRALSIRPSSPEVQLITPGSRTSQLLSPEPQIIRPRSLSSRGLRSESLAGRALSIRSHDPEVQLITPGSRSSRSPSSRALSIRPSNPEVQLITPGSRSSRSHDPTIQLITPGSRGSRSGVPRIQLIRPR